jgi:DNA-binding response OmpR family regulator
MVRVLVIDDEAPIRLLCRVNLEAEGMEVLEAADGHNGLELAWEQVPDVILLDVVMRGLDGWRVAERLLSQERTAQIPIVFLTARVELRERLRGLELGALDYVVKPFSPAELTAVVLSAASAVERGERDLTRAERITLLRSVLEHRLTA